jgi:hypothetical protein
VVATKFALRMFLLITMLAALAIACGGWSWDGALF